MIETLGQLKDQVVTTAQSQTDNDTPTKKLPSNKEVLDSLEEIKDGRAYNIIHTLIEDTPKEEKNRE